MSAGPTKDQAWSGYRAAQGAAIDAGFAGDVTPRDAIDTLAAELAALKARRCDGCKWYTPEHSSYGACAMPNEERPMSLYFFDSSTAMPEVLVDADHACNAWEARSDG